jgi:CBS domain-containing protein
MWTQDCGCLPVIETDGIGRVIGMITDRDICMSALFQGRPLHDLSVSEAMSKTLRTCRPSDSLATAERLMQEAQIRRLPVVADEGSLVGLLSLGDLAREALREQCSPIKELTGDEIGTTLASICAPAGKMLAA